MSFMKIGCVGIKEGIIQNGQKNCNLFVIELIGENYYSFYFQSKNL